MGNRMTHAPVFYALAQVRFNTVMAMDRYVVEFQEWMRKNGFPELQRTVQATFNLNLLTAAPEGVPALPPPFGQQTQYRFSDMAQTTGFILDQNGLMIQTTEYSDSDDFSAKFLAALAMIHEVVNLSYTERVGTRYLDLVMPTKGEGLSEFLEQPFLGLVGKMDRELEHSFSETRTKKNGNVLVSRAIIQDRKGPIAMPPDLSPLTLKIMDRFATVGGLHATIDTDCWHEKREPFSVDQVANRLTELRAEIGASFKAMVTPYALKVWK